MGLFFKKSKDFGLFKLNASKSGIGVSTGVKGLRVGLGPNGAYIHAGSNGMYYRKNIGISEDDMQNFDKLREIYSETVSEPPKIIEGERLPLEIIQEKIQVPSPSKISMIILAASFILCFVNDLFILLLAGVMFVIAIKQCIKYFNKFDLVSECFKTTQEQLEKFSQFVKVYNKFAKMPKYTTKIENKMFGKIPDFVNKKDRYELPAFIYNNDVHYFTPDFVISFINFQSYITPYSSFESEIILSKVQIDSPIMYDGAKIIQENYSHVKNDGTPDLRYKDDVVYTLEFTGINFLGETWLCTDDNIVDEFVNGIKILSNNIQVSDNRQELVSVNGDK